MSGRTDAHGAGRLGRRSVARSNIDLMLSVTASALLAVVTGG
ncbi:MAG TPA: hypothetical protein VFH48_38975 [Chloroflexota bacterium]|nr:hypothetical protein [Chloroflexota bacterium]